MNASFSSKFSLVFCPILADRIIGVRGSLLACSQNHTRIRYLAYTPLEIGEMFFVVTQDRELIY